MADAGGSDGHSSFADKLKHPFQGLREKLHGTHLHDAKIHLVHKKFVYVALTCGERN